MCIVSFPRIFLEELWSWRRRCCENQRAKRVSRFRRPTLSPSLKHISSPSSTKPNSCPFLDGPQDWGYNKTAYTKTTRRSFTASPRARNIDTISLLLGENGGWKSTSVYPENPEMIRPTTALGRIICCRSDRKKRSPCTACRKKVDREPNS